MQKRQAGKMGLFEYMERKTIEDYSTRRKLTSRENTYFDLLAKEKELSPDRTERKNELERMSHYIKPAQKLFLLARNTKNPHKGRRFLYRGTDHQIHIGRLGKPLKVKMLAA
jgi:hypothetical protein